MNARSSFMLSPDVEQIDGLVHLLLRSGVEAVRVERLARELLEAQFIRSSAIEFEDFASLRASIRDLLDDRIEKMRSDQNVALASIGVHLASLRRETQLLRPRPTPPGSTGNRVTILLGALVLAQIAVLATCIFLVVPALDERCNPPSPTSGRSERAVAVALNADWNDHGYSAASR